MANLVYWIWFSGFTSLDANTKTSLLESFGDAESIYNCTDYSDYPYLSLKDRTTLMNKRLDTASRIIEESNELGIQIIPFDSPLYPEVLREIYNPPYVLYTKGNIPDWQENLFIGVVGTRRCSEYGITVTRSFCKELAEYGVITISGLARGIDTEAAASTLSAGGKTIAVLGSGLDICYPSENAELMKQVAENGLLISEYPPGTPPLNFHFPMRNRIISGISNGIIVTDSPRVGGSLITAKRALEQGKDVFAVPGSIFQKNSEGTNRLISKGSAKAVMSAKDILCEYEHMFSFDKITPEQKPDVTENNSNTELFNGLSEDEEKIARLLLNGPMHADEIMRRTNLPAAEITTIFSMLEFSGIIERQSGNIYKLNI